MSNTTFNNQLFTQLLATRLQINTNEIQVHSFKPIEQHDLNEVIYEINATVNNTQDTYQLDKYDVLTFMIDKANNL